MSAGRLVFVGVQRSRQRQPRQENSSHLKWIRTLSCCVCGARPVEAAHLRAGNRVYGKRETGKGEKPSDKWVTPLCPAHHGQQHLSSEERFWAHHGLNPFSLAMALWICTGDDHAAEMILRGGR